jgi:calcineurin-like phosphoesterase family protein
VVEEVFWLRRTDSGPAGILLGPPPEPLPDWVISDTHFGHKKIVELAGRPADHEQQMVDSWKRLVGDGDTVLHLGDVSYRSREWLDRLARLPGRVQLVRGNHDQPQDVRRYRRIGWEILEPFLLTWRGWRVLVTHEPQERARLPRQTLNLHGHLHERFLTPKHINVCVEVRGYRPVRLAELLDRHLAEIGAIRLPQGA